MKPELEKQIKEHGKKLIKAFGLKDADPISLCKSLRRIEVRGNHLAVQYCNGEKDQDQVNALLGSMAPRVVALLGSRYPVKFNLDPRGCFLKIDDAVMRDNDLDLPRDMGGYGLIAPELS